MNKFFPRSPLALLLLASGFLAGPGCSGGDRDKCQKLREATLRDLAALQPLREPLTNAKILADRLEQLAQILPQPSQPQTLTALRRAAHETGIKELAVEFSDTATRQSGVLAAPFIMRGVLPRREGRKPDAAWTLLDRLAQAHETLALITFVRVPDAAGTDRFLVSGEHLFLPPLPPRPRLGIEHADLFTLLPECDPDPEAALAATKARSGLARLAELDLRKFRDYRDELEKHKQALLEWQHRRLILLQLSGVSLPNVEGWAGQAMAPCRLAVARFEARRIGFDLVACPGEIELARLSRQFPDFDAALSSGELDGKKYQRVNLNVRETADLESPATATPQ